MTEIFDIRQLDENCWQAKYNGNYGIYTVKMSLSKNGRATNYSCTCPSDYYPCKHIGFVQTAIKEQIRRQEKQKETPALTVEDVLKNVSFEELRTFVIDKARYNADLTNEIFLKFAENIRKANNMENGKNEENEKNPYSGIIGKGLSQIDFTPDCYHDYDYDYDGEYSVDLDILNEWYKKAAEFVKEKKYENAILICKACIEEYALWLSEQNDSEYDAGDFIQENFMSEFFGLLKQIANSGQIDKKALYEYCKTEMKKEEYEYDTVEEFYNLMTRLASEVNPDEFIALQEALLENVENRSSQDAKNILDRIIEVYKASNRQAEAEHLIENNLQIEEYCRQTVEKRIELKDYDGAKRLINGFTARSKHHNRNAWKELLLNIAQKENNIADIQNIALEFLNQSFDNNHFDIYKSTFQPEEWTPVFEQLYDFYEKQKKPWFSHYNEDITNLLCAENLLERLMDFMENNLHIEALERYYTAFYKQYPAKTLALFRKAIDEYAEKNMGRGHYEYINELLRMIRKIQNGDTVVNDMVAIYRVKYKNRRAMMEILNKI